MSGGAPMFSGIPPVGHRPDAISSAAGWLGVCSCGWRSDDWHRAKNSAVKDARLHKRAEILASAKSARNRHDWGKGGAV